MLVKVLAFWRSGIFKCIEFVSGCWLASGRLMVFTFLAVLFSDVDFFSVALFTTEVAAGFVRWACGDPMVIDSAVETSLLLFDILARKWRPFALSWVIKLGLLTALAPGGRLHCIVLVSWSALTCFGVASSARAIFMASLSFKALSLVNSFLRTSIERTPKIMYQWVALLCLCIHNPQWVLWLLSWNCRLSSGFCFNSRHWALPTRKFDFGRTFCWSFAQ